jgi:acetyl-CoA acetyltransferase
VTRANALRLRWPFVRNVLADALIAAGIGRDQGMPVLRHAAARYLFPFPEVNAATLAGSQPASIAARICGYFGFQGGGYAVDGAASSSLLAVAKACGELVAGDLDVVVAGGVDVSLDPAGLVGRAKAGLLAAGDMRVYDANPTGFLPGEGCGVLVLMRAAEARAAGLPVLAEIAGWGVSSATQRGVTGPEPASQLLALRRAYHRARVDPADVQLFEGDGAGTAAGDYAELTALTALRHGARRLAALGSVKANIGHTGAAAGAAGLIKTILAMSSTVIPPATGSSMPHPLLLGQQGSIALPDRPVPWPAGPQLAAVSAVDPGGSCVHVVLSREPVRSTRPERGLRLPGRGGRGETAHAAPAAQGGQPGLAAAPPPGGPWAAPDGEPDGPGHTLPSGIPASVPDPGSAGRSSRGPATGPGPGPSGPGPVTGRGPDPVGHGGLPPAVPGPDGRRYRRPAPATPAGAAWRAPGRPGQDWARAWPASWPGWGRPASPTRPRGPLPTSCTRRTGASWPRS